MDRNSSNSAELMARNLQASPRVCLLCARREGPRPREVLQHYPPGWRCLPYAILFQSYEQRGSYWGASLWRLRYFKLHERLIFTTYPQAGRQLPRPFVPDLRRANSTGSLRMGTGQARARCHYIFKRRPVDGNAGA